MTIEKLKAERDSLLSQRNTLIGMLAYWVPLREPLLHQTDEVAKVHKREWREAREMISRYTYNSGTGYTAKNAVMHKKKEIG
jgi:hypothetical protein